MQDGDRGFQVMHFMEMWDGLGLGCLETPALLRSLPMEEVGARSPTLALKIESSPSTRDFKLCFKAKQHPWARDVGFYLGSICRSYRKSGCKLFYRWSWMKGSDQNYS